MTTTTTPSDVAAQTDPTTLLLIDHGTGSERTGVPVGAAQTDPTEWPATYHDGRHAHGRPRDVLAYLATVHARDAARIARLKAEPAQDRRADAEPADVRPTPPPLTDNGVGMGDGKAERNARRAGRILTERDVWRITARVVNGVCGPDVSEPERDCIVSLVAERALRAVGERTPGGYVVPGRRLSTEWLRWKAIGVLRGDAAAETWRDVAHPDAGSLEDVGDAATEPEPYVPERDLARTARSVAERMVDAGMIDPQAKTGTEAAAFALLAAGTGRAAEGATLARVLGLKAGTLREAVRSFRARAAKAGEDAVRDVVAQAVAAIPAPDVRDPARPCLTPAEMAAHAAVRALSPDTPAPRKAERRDTLLAMPRNGDEWVTAPACPLRPRPATVTERPEPAPLPAGWARVGAGSGKTATAWTGAERDVVSAMLRHRAYGRGPARDVVAFLGEVLA